MEKSQKYVFHLAGLKWIIEHTEAEAQAIIADKRELDNKNIFKVVYIQTFPNESLCKYLFRADQTDEYDRSR